MKLTTAVAAAVTVALTVPAVAVPASSSARAGHRATQAAMDAAVKDGVPGAVAQAKDRQGTWRAVSGVGDIRTERPRSVHDRYRVGSITKTFVATVVLQLEAEGRLSLDDTVERWLPGLVLGHGHDGRGITLRQLLNHTSGIHDYSDDETFRNTYALKDGFFEHRYDTLSPHELVRVAMRHEPEFEPGTSWSYSNTNYVLAGLVIEKATGNPYGDEIRHRIIEPLKLRATTVPGTSTRMPHPSSRAYGKLALTDTGPTYDVTEINPSVAHAAGEMISDSGDLNRFYSALLTGELLPARQLAAMKTTVEEGMPPRVGYGLGIMKLELGCGRTVWGHSGSIRGSSSVAVTTEDGRHLLAFNFNNDWSGDSRAVVEAEFCDA
ncbi:serine hydrolase domain-containing protein [Streptomyces sp. MJP52]|uniref:serine hydrolase domain-containing protein n=1 Tax=Streptomyces sp. MJP52 TaxID=2940555 RepID=UPI0024751B9B|nr:serine hydrolase domain-containing protein [Streptomyces sp. MJP52]